jgi:hypothetical protein
MRTEAQTSESFLCLNFLYEYCSFFAAPFIHQESFQIWIANQDIIKQFSTELMLSLNLNHKEILRYAYAISGLEYANIKNLYENKVSRKTTHGLLQGHPNEVFNLLQDNQKLRACISKFQTNEVFLTAIKNWHQLDPKRKNKKIEIEAFLKKILAALITNKNLFPKLLVLLFDWQIFANKNLSAIKFWAAYNGEMGSLKVDAKYRHHLEFNCTTVSNFIEKIQSTLDPRCNKLKQLKLFLSLILVSIDWLLDIFNDKLCVLRHEVLALDLAFVTKNTKNISSNLFSVIDLKKSYLNLILLNDPSLKFYFAAEPSLNYSTYQKLTKKINFKLFSPGPKDIPLIENIADINFKLLACNN